MYTDPSAKERTDETLLDSLCQEAKALHIDVPREGTTTMSQLLRWEPLSSSVVDQGPLFLSCATLDVKTRQLIGVASLEKNRFCELVRFDIGWEYEFGSLSFPASGTCRWTGCTRTRHFRPPKRIGSASVAARGHILIFGGYELSNQIESLNNGARYQRGVTPIALSSSSSNKRESRLRLFGYPPWCFDCPTADGGSSLIGEALGDFHGYDSGRGEWSVIISRDRTPVGVTGEYGSSINSERSVWRRPSQQNWQSTAGGVRARPATLVSGNCIGDPLPEGRAFHTLVKCENVLYLFGGERLLSKQSQAKQSWDAEQVEYLNDLWLCDLHDLRWTLLSDEYGRDSFSELRHLDARRCATEQIHSEKAETDINWRSRTATVDIDHPLDLTSASSMDFGMNGFCHPDPRSCHTASVYQRVMYIYGGQNSAMLFGDLWMFDSVSSCPSGWTMLNPSGTSPGQRYGHTSVVVGHGMCVYGGIGLPDTEWVKECYTSTDGFSRQNAINFSDNNVIYHLDFESLVWSELQITGCPPADARYFGRLQGFCWDNFLWLGGATGRESFDGFEFSRVDISEILSTVRTTTGAATTTSSASKCFRNKDDFYIPVNPYNHQRAASFDPCYVRSERKASSSSSSIIELVTSVSDSNATAPALLSLNNTSEESNDIPTNHNSAIALISMQDFVRSPPLSPSQRSCLRHVRYAEASSNTWGHWPASLHPISTGDSSDTASVHLDSGVYMHKDFVPSATWVPPAPLTAQQFLGQGGVNSSGCDAQQATRTPDSAETTLSDGPILFTRSKTSFPARSPYVKRPKGEERVLLDVACVNRLQHDATVAREENAMLREAILLLIPYLNIQDLTGTLHAAEITQHSAQGLASANHHAAISNNHWIIEAMLQATQRPSLLQTFHESPHRPQ